MLSRFNEMKFINKYHVAPQLLPNPQAPCNHNGKRPMPSDTNEVLVPLAFLVCAFPRELQYAGTPGMKTF
jgi:hypothetical protein